MDATRRSPRDCRQRWPAWARRSTSTSGSGTPMRCRTPNRGAKRSTHRRPRPLPVAVVATAGTTSTGAIDPLGAIGEMAREHGVRFHVDGAYELPGLLDGRKAPLYDGLEQADSAIVDPHKWLGASVGVTATYVRDRELLRRAFTQEPAGPSRGHRRACRLRAGGAQLVALTLRRKQSQPDHQNSAPQRPTPTGRRHSGRERRSAQLETASSTFREPCGQAISGQPKRAPNGTPLHDECRRPERRCVPRPRREPGTRPCRCSCRSLLETAEELGSLRPQGLVGLGHLARIEPGLPAALHQLVKALVQVGHAGAIRQGEVG
jgi:hypothetical protein